MPSYLENLILSMYQEPTNTGQVHNVLSGRSTPSILYLTEIKEWKHLYGLLPQLSRKRIDDVQFKFKSNQFIEPIKSENKFQLTKPANKMLSDFFKLEFEPKPISSFMPYDLRSDFWLVICFVSQVVSEKTYQNSRYRPLKQDITSQFFVKNILRHNKNFEINWVKEQATILNSVNPLMADILANSLLGHDVNALTLNQLARSMNLQKDQVYVMRFSAIYDYFKWINGQDFPLHQKVLDYSIKTQGYGLTPSALNTLNLLEKGYNLNQIAVQKNIKLSTVKEHILEVAFKRPEINLIQLIPSGRRQEILNYFKASKDRQFRYAKEQISGLEFYHYRLIELELLRNGG